MVTLRPFKAVRPLHNLENKIAALPYDVYNRNEAKKVVSENSLSFLKIDRAETSFDDSVGTYDKCVYDKALELYNNMKQDNYFVKDSSPCFYIYAQTMNGRKQIGLVAAASCKDYENNIIKKHENTRADKEQDRINHVSGLSAQTGPIFLSYRNNKTVSDFLTGYTDLNEAYADFVSDDGIRHECWIIDKEEDINFIIEQFNKIDSLYVADGHHRLASAYAVSKLRPESEEAQFFLSVIFPDNQLMILDYNRIVKDLNGFTEEEFIEQVKNKFDVVKIDISNNKPATKGDFYMFLGDSEYKISLKEQYIKNDPIGCLDVSVLQENLLSPVLGIKDPKTDKRIDFIGGIRGVEELRRRMTIDAKVAFALFPTQMSELFAVADANLLMPPKSTWFEPKLRSGLFIHEI